MDTKICTKCGIEKPLRDFCNSKITKDGKQGNCKECSLKYRRAYSRYCTELRQRAEMLMAFRTLKRDIKRVAEKR